MLPVVGSLENGILTQSICFDVAGGRFFVENE